MQDQVYRIILRQKSKSKVMISAFIVNSKCITIKSLYKKMTALWMSHCIKWHEMMGRATQECGSRSLQILHESGFAWSRLYLYMINGKSRFVSVLHVVFEDATLTQFHLSHALRTHYHHRPSTRTLGLCYHVCALLALIVDFKSTAHTAIYTT